MITRGADVSEAGNEWATLRAGLNERGRVGFRVVAVSEGTEGRAIIMERELEHGLDLPSATAAAQTVSEAAESITHDSAERHPGAPPHTGQP